MGSEQALAIPGHEHVVQVVTQTNLVSNQASLAAQQDADLQNAWGLAFAPTGPAWVSANGAGLSQVYDSTGTLRRSVVIPAPSGAEPPSAPTGQVFNADAASFLGDRFIFVTEDGTVAGWQASAGASAVLRVDNSAAQSVYKGVALLAGSEGARLYATDFHNAKIDVWDASYAKISTAGHFVDPFLPPHYAPFNVIVHGTQLWVSFAKQKLPEKKDDQAGPGHGYIDAFDAEGHLLQRLVSRGALDSPWGMTVAPADVGALSERLLVGNFGDGRIHAYRLIPFGPFVIAWLEGALGDAPDHPLSIDGLWSLSFGPGVGGFSAHDLYFTAGPNDEADGLFGQLALP